MRTRFDIIEVDMESENKYAGLAEALTRKSARIINSVHAGTNVIYVVQSEE